jgi:hypothetical protein
MTFKKTEKEIIKTIVKYDGEVKSLAEVINKSELLEKRGIAVATDGNMSFIFLKKDRYDYDDKEPLGYVTELVSLINTLVEKRLLVIIPLDASPELVIGRKASRWYKPGLVVVDEKEYVQVDRNMFDWLNSKGEQIYWPVNCPEKTLPVCKTIYSWFTVSQELKDLVEHNFETEEERRFIKQQQLTWISIAVTAFIGIAGLIIAIISICR